MNGDGVLGTQGHFFDFASGVTNGSTSHYFSHVSILEFSLHPVTPQEPHFHWQQSHILENYVNTQNSQNDSSAHESRLVHPNVVLIYQIGYQMEFSKLACPNKTLDLFPRDLSQNPS